MIELTFDESAAGALKMAKAMKQGTCIITGVPGMSQNSKRRQQEERTPRYWTGITMEGSSQDVEELVLTLDIGDISCMDHDINARKKVLEDLFGDFHHAPHTRWDASLHALNRLCEAKTTKEPVRIWICDSNPAELCGLAFVCHILRNSDIPLTVVPIPKLVEKEDSISIYYHTGSINPEMLGLYAQAEKPISKIQHNYYEGIWRELQQENAPLRAFLNGCLLGVPIDFYDFALRANLSNSECTIGQLIGKTILQVPCVNDRILYVRIKAMLKAGELVRVSTAADDHPYSEVVKPGDCKQF
jgi:hypothetical protein